MKKWEKNHLKPSLTNPNSPAGLNQPRDTPGCNCDRSGGVPEWNKNKYL